MLVDRSRIPSWTNFSSLSNKWYSSNKTTSLPPQNLVIETWSQRLFRIIMMGVFSTLKVSRSNLWTKDYIFEGNCSFKFESDLLPPELSSRVSLLIICEQSGGKNVPFRCHHTRFRPPSPPLPVPELDLLHLNTLFMT